MILAGDVVGTKTHLALFDPGPPVRPVRVATAVAAQLGIPPLALLNDLEASAWGLELLGEADVAALLPGAPAAAGNQAVISAGTGLGEAVLLRRGSLRALATGGLFLGGGIAPKILPWLRREPFRRGFLDEARLSPLVAATPVKVILAERIALLGAARVAAEALR